MALLQGCATTLKLDPVALDGQQEIFQEGTKTLISAKQSLVAIRPSSTTYQSDKRPTLVVSVLNGRDDQFNFSTEDIEVFANGHSVKIFTYDELVAEIKRQQAWAAVAVALSGAAQSISAANAGYTYHSGTFNSSYYSNYGYSGYGYGSYSGYSYNAAAAQQAQAAVNAQTQANMAAISARTDQALNELGATILKKSTVFPQKIHGRYIKLEKLEVPEKVNEIVVKVNAGGEMHEFKFRHLKVEQ